MKRLRKKLAAIDDSIIADMGRDWDIYIEELYEYIHHGDKTVFSTMKSIVDEYPKFKSYLNNLVSGITLYRGLGFKNKEELDSLLKNPDNLKLNEKNYVSTSMDRDTAVGFARWDGRFGLLITYQAKECIFHYQILNEEMDQDFELEQEVIIVKSSATIINMEKVEEDR